MGVIVHGATKTPYAFTSLENVRNDSNLNIHCLLQVLDDMNWDRDYPTNAKRVLYLQLDKASDNRNLNVMAFMQLFVECGIFRKVNLSPHSIILSSTTFGTYVIAAAHIGMYNGSNDMY